MTFFLSNIIYIINGDDMRTFYIFKINNMFQTFYNDKSNILFKMLCEIYNSDSDDFINNFRLFEQITLPFNKKIFNNYILLKHGSDFYYSRKDNIHIIDSAYEVSRLTVNTTHLKIKTNTNINSFIRDIIDTKESVFVVDFDNKDYFWIDEINSLTLA